MVELIVTITATSPLRILIICLLNSKENTEYFESKNSCGLCSEDYEEDQEIYRLPSNYLCCRRYTEKIFSILEDGSKQMFSVGSAEMIALK